MASQQKTSDMQLNAISKTISNHKEGKSMIICLVGPSGSGKTAISEEALKTNPLMFGKVRTATTREKRPNEKDDAYYFYSEKRKNRRI